MTGQAPLLADAAFGPARSNGYGSTAGGDGDRGAALDRDQPGGTAGGDDGAGQVQELSMAAGRPGHAHHGWARRQQPPAAGQGLPQPLDPFIRDQQRTVGAGEAGVLPGGEGQQEDAVAGDAGGAVGAGRVAGGGAGIGWRPARRISPSTARRSARSGLATIT